MTFPDLFPSYDFVDLFEVRLSELPEQLRAGLWNPKEWTTEEIFEALVAALKENKLNLKRGVVGSIGKHQIDPAILDAREVDRWATRWLEIDPEGPWAGYLARDEAVARAVYER